jgi:hypothetical protein
LCEDSILDLQGQIHGRTESSPKTSYTDILLLQRLVKPRLDRAPQSHHLSITKRQNLRFFSPTQTTCLTNIPVMQSFHPIHSLCLPTRRDLADQPTIQFYQNDQWDLDADARRMSIPNPEASRLEDTCLGGDLNNLALAD